MPRRASRSSPRRTSCWLKKPPPKAPPLGGPSPPHASCWRMGSGQVQKSVFSGGPFRPGGEVREARVPGTEAVNQAVEAAGGGTLHFPAGTYPSFSIRLQSHVRPAPGMFGTLPAYGLFVRHARNLTVRISPSATRGTTCGRRRGSRTQGFLLRKLGSSGPRARVRLPSGQRAPRTSRSGSGCSRASGHRGPGTAARSMGPPPRRTPRRRPRPAATRPGDGSPDAS